MTRMRCTHFQTKNTIVFIDIFSHKILFKTLMYKVRTYYLKLIYKANNSILDFTAEFCTLEGVCSSHPYIHRAPNSP